MKIEVFRNSISDFIVGFLFMEMLSFIFYLISVGLFKLNYWTHFIPILIILIWQIYELVIRKEKKINYFIRYKEYYPILILFSVISSFLLYEGCTQFVTALTNKGVLHVDMIYHAGITNSMLEFGYPIKDLQYEGSIVLYHIFTHFICSQFSFISGYESYQIFTLFFPFFSVFTISILIFDILKTQFSSRFLIIKYLIIGIIAFLGAYFLPGSWGNMQIHELFVSPSYQFQLICLIIISAYILLSGNCDYSFKYYCILLVLFCFSIFTKGSNLPLLLFGFSFLFINKFWRLKKIVYSDILFLFVCIILGSIIYKFFFSFEYSNRDNYTTFWGFNWTYINDSFFNYLLSYKLGFSVHIIKWVTFSITIISFRYYIVKYIEQPVVAFSIGMLSIGILLLFFYNNNPINFFQAPIFIINLYFGIFLLQFIKDISKPNLLIIFGLLSLSIYPISSYGFQMKRWMIGEINRYYPISIERIDLYQFINQTTNKNDIIFTPSVYGATNFSPDNFYPAALSKRVFYLGGYEYGNIKYYSDFNKRLKIVNDFSFKADQFNTLKSENVKFVLVEYKGNKRDLSMEIKETILIGKSASFKVIFSNSAGVILELL